MFAVVVLCGTRIQFFDQKQTNHSRFRRGSGRLCGRRWNDRVRPCCRAGRPCCDRTRPGCRVRSGGCPVVLELGEVVLQSPDLRLTRRHACVGGQIVRELLLPRAGGLLLQRLAPLLPFGRQSPRPRPAAKIVMKPIRSFQIWLHSFYMAVVRASHDVIYKANQRCVPYSVLKWQPRGESQVEGAILARLCRRRRVFSLARLFLSGTNLDRKSDKSSTDTNRLRTASNSHLLIGFVEQ